MAAIPTSARATLVVEHPLRSALKLNNSGQSRASDVVELSLSIGEPSPSLQLSFRQVE